jgi:hypothetical protein
MKKISDLLPKSNLEVEELLQVRGGVDSLELACGCTRMCKKKACKTGAVKESRT